MADIILNLRNRFYLKNGKSEELEHVEVYLQKHPGVNANCLKKIFNEINGYVLYECEKALVAANKLQQLMKIRNIIFSTISTEELERLPQSLLIVYSLKTGSEDCLEYIFRGAKIKTKIDKKTMDAYKQIANEIAMDRGLLIVNTAMQLVQMPHDMVDEPPCSLQVIAPHTAGGCLKKPAAKSPKTVRFTS
jgi:hypothetical protein